MKGARIHGIVRELRNENIDVIPYTDNVKLFISRALSPARVSDIVLYEEHKRADVFLKSEEISLAIGKGGMNIKLASMLSGYQIEVYRDDNINGDDEDILLDEFLDEIDPWVIETLKGIGCDTAKNVLAIPRDELVVHTDLEEETVDDVIRILSSEFNGENAAPATKLPPTMRPKKLMQTIIRRQKATVQPTTSQLTRRLTLSSNTQGG